MKQVLQARRWVMEIVVRGTWAVIGLFAGAACGPVSAAELKPCEDLKREIAEKVEAKGVSRYVLAIVANSASTQGKEVVGHCEGGTKIVVYQRQ